MAEVKSTAERVTYTPGPWAVDGDGLLVAVLVTDGGLTSCDVTAACMPRYEPIGEEGLRANARLIAAAPELLAALKQQQKFTTHNAMCLRTIERAEWQCSCGFNRAYDAASLAIMKAEGHEKPKRDSAQPCGCDPGESYTCEQHRGTEVTR